MKKLLLPIFILISVAVYAQKTASAFSISGKFKKVLRGKVYLNVHKETGNVIDSATIKNGAFRFKGHVQKPSVAFLAMKGHKEDSLSFFVEPVKMIITGDGDKLNDLTISGSTLNDDNKKLLAFLKPVSDEKKMHKDAYAKANNANDNAAMDSLEKLAPAMKIRKRNFIKQFVLANPTSLRSVLAISENFGYHAEAEEVEPLYNALSTTLKNTEAGIAVKKMLDLYKTLAMGQIAPDITQLDTTGKSLSLSSLKGKYVLVDFWASWCGPCRRENRKLVKAYQIYSPKGFEVFGVSSDSEKGASKWKKAIVDDGLVWKNVSDLQGMKNSAIKQYNITQLPSNFLLDKDGRIIAKNLFGKKLSDKLSELMN